MANPTAPTRLSPAELRRRLLAPAPEASAPPIVLEDAPQPMARSNHRRDTNRYATQAAIDLDALMLEATGPATAKHTPLPEGRLDASHFRSSMDFQLPAAPPAHAPQAKGHNHAQGHDELSMLRIQNAELTRIVEEMKPLLEEASAAEARVQTHEREFQDQLAEKELLLEEAQARVVQLTQELANLPAAKTPKTRDELEEWSDELEQESSKLGQERKRLQEEHRQLKDDEESLEKQMREMECSMARERAMMARQETELKRLSAEIQHELEMLQRGDGTLREQLSKFQRRHQEVLTRTMGSGPPSMSGASSPFLDLPPEPAAAPAKKESGMFARIFRGTNK